MKLIGVFLLLVLWTCEGSRVAGEFLETWVNIITFLTICFLISTMELFC